MPFTYAKTVHFGDTDAAGVVFFANYLVFCHEAYEEALQAAGINLRTFFAESGVVVPISKSEAAYLRPLSCGDAVTVTVTPRALSEDSFEIAYEIHRQGPPSKCAARVRTEHVCIDPATRSRMRLPDALAGWIAASGGLDPLPR